MAPVYTTVENGNHNSLAAHAQPFPHQRCADVLYAPGRQGLVIGEDGVGQADAVRRGKAAKGKIGHNSPDAGQGGDEGQNGWVNGGGNGVDDPKGTNIIGQAKPFLLGEQVE